MTNDNLNIVWNKFFSQRTRTLWERFPGYYRALVVETNDPLNMYRIRFKCPDMHDFNLKPEECPWAVPAFDLGGGRAGRFVHPCIGDWVWITFERQHPYGPIWVGFANPTRRKLYAYPQIFQITPLSVDEEGRPADQPQDYQMEYLPKDGRPMLHGWQDRYGNMDIHSSVGFYPKEHEVPPPPPDHDAIQGSKFQQMQQIPEVNNPDKKYMARITKYGVMLILSDQGYYWNIEKGGVAGEFTGDFKKDEEFERRRWFALQKMLNEGVPRSDLPNGDARRALIMTRYGHRIECRDTGWAQLGPVTSQSRAGEFGPPRVLSKEQVNDFRWIKIRTKGGMLLQAYDKGFHPDDDIYVKRPIMKELGYRSEREDIYWKDKDARWIRLITRWGIKIVLDDRGSDDKMAHKRTMPCGNGILLKGRRAPGSRNDRPSNKDSRGFFWEFNENDAANHTMWGSPRGLTAEINDRYEYMMFAVSMGKRWSMRWEGIKENEFIGKPTMMRNPERNSHHLKLDHQNEYIRLKTRANKGSKPYSNRSAGLSPVNPSGVKKSELNQGFEAHDGSRGMGPWVEITDCQHRGMWWSKKYRLGIWRARKGKKMYIWMHDGSKKIVIYNDEKDGTIEIYTKGNVNVVSQSDVSISADRSVNIRAGRLIKMQAGDTMLTVGGAGVRTNKTYFGRRLRAQICTHQVQGIAVGSGSGRVKIGGRSVGVQFNVRCRVQAHTARGCQDPGGIRVKKPPVPQLPEHVEPDDRAKTYNEPFEMCPREEVEHPIR